MVNDASSISRSGYTQNPRLAEAAFEGVRKNTDFLKAADKAFKDVVATKAGDLKAGTKSGESAINTVGLKPPTDAAREKLSSEGQLTLLLGKLMTLLGDVSLSQLESRLAVWQAMIESQKEMGIQVSKEFQTALGEAQEATDLYEASIKKTDTAKSVYDAAAKKLTQAQNKLQSLDPADPGYAQAEAAVEQAGKEATEAKEALDKATDATVKAGTDAKAKAEKADNILTKFQERLMPPLRIRFPRVSRIICQMSPASLCSWPCLLRLWAKIRKKACKTILRFSTPCRKGVRRRWKRNRLNSVKRRAKPRKRTALWDVSGKSSARC